MLRRLRGPYRKLLVQGPPINGPKTLADRLVETRLRLGETQAEFAWHFGICAGTYARWEKRGPPAGPSTVLVRLLLRKLGSRDRIRARWRADKARQRAAAKAARPLAIHGE
jgi:hypothetical protein